MKFFRILIVLWLSLAVPTAALASLVNEGHCQRDSAASTPATDNAQHAMHAGMQMQDPHAQHLAQAAKLTKADQSHCGCGCNCSGTHCATSCSGLMAMGALRGVFSPDADTRQLSSEPARPVTAHLLELLRPPSLI